jgi:hypothetical protein
MEHEHFSVNHGHSLQHSCIINLDYICTVKTISLTLNEVGHVGSRQAKIPLAASFENDLQNSLKRPCVSISNVTYPRSLSKRRT